MKFKILSSTIFYDISLNKIPRFNMKIIFEIKKKITHHGIIKIELLLQGNIFIAFKNELFIHEQETQNTNSLLEYIKNRENCLRFISYCIWGAIL